MVKNAVDVPLSERLMSELSISDVLGPASTVPRPSSVSQMRQAPVQWLVPEFQTLSSN